MMLSTTDPCAMVLSRPLAVGSLFARFALQRAIQSAGVMWLVKMLNLPFLLRKWR